MAVILVLEMAVAGWRLMAVIVSGTVTTCNYQPGTSQDQAGLDICDVRSYTATNNQIHRVSICLAVQCSAAVSKYRIKY